MPFAHAQVADWFPRRTFGPGPGIDRLVALKHEHEARVSVCLPALDEEPTIGAICECITAELMAPGLVDELVCVDSGSRDRTVEVARRAGARVHAAADLTEFGSPVLGKGDVLWRSLTVVHGDIVVWVDSDIRDFGARFVTGLVAPLLAHDDIVFVKGYYRRPLQEGTGGARVTEIAVRPLLSLLAPELAGFVQPLAGECAGRRRALAATAFCTGYGVEIGLLFDLWKSFGLDALAQADLGERRHRPRHLAQLGRTSFEVVQTLLSRLERAGRVTLVRDLADRLVQFDHAHVPYAASRPIVDRPPLTTPAGV